MKIGPIFFLLATGLLLGFLWCLFVVEIRERGPAEIPVAASCAKPKPAAPIAREANLGIGFLSGRAGPDVLSEQVKPNAVLITCASLPGGGMQVFVVQCKGDSDDWASPVEPTRDLAERVRLAYVEGVDFTCPAGGTSAPRLTQRVYALHPLSPGTARIVTAHDFLNLPKAAHTAFAPIPVGGGNAP